MQSMFVDGKYTNLYFFYETEMRNVICLKKKAIEF